MVSSKVCLLCHNIGPYHHARYTEAAKRIPSLSIIQLAAKQDKYPWQLKPSQLKDITRTLFNGTIEHNSGSALKIAVRRALKEIYPDVVVVVGYSDPGMRGAAAWAKANKKKCIMLTATWKSTKKRLFIKEIWKTYWCKKMYHGIFIPGIRSQDYFAGLGFPVSRIWRGVDIVDNEYFSNCSNEARATRETLSRRLNIPKDYFICVARHSKEKNLGFLLEAFHKYKRKGGKWSMVIAGDGPERSALEEKAHKLSLGDIQFVGWVSYEKLPLYYGLARALVLPSVDEPWGLAVNEAMASGLPIIISRNCGCLPELCWRGINGYDFDPRNQEELTEILIKMSSDEIDVASMGEAGRTIISNYSPFSWAQVLEDCINVLVNAPINHDN